MRFGKLNEKISKTPALKCYLTLLNLCDRLMYSNLYQLLKISFIVPVSVVTAECSFSTLRRLKTYPRKTKSDSKMVELVLLSIHKYIEIIEEIILKKFTNSDKNININLCIINYFYFFFSIYFVIHVIHFLRTL